MAFYGIPSAGGSLSATESNDTVSLAGRQSGTLTANTVLGLGGNDLLYLGAQGFTAVASARVLVSGSGNSGSYSGAASLVGEDITYVDSYSGTWSGATASAAISGGVTGVVTSQAAARQFIASQLYGNAGNDSIALGNQLSTVSAATIGGGAGDDILGSYSNVNNVFTGNNALDLSGVGGIGTAATFAQFFAEGGGGNDTVYLNLSGSTLTGSTLQGGQGNDSVALVMGAGSTINAVNVFGGGGNDDISAQVTGGSGINIAGGGGNDSIAMIVSGTTVFTNSTVAGDVNDLAGGSYDGDDIISAELGTFSSVTVAGQGGNDTITVTGEDAGANLIAGGTGNDAITMQGTASATTTIAGGAGSDTVTFASGANTTLVMLGGDNDHLVISGKVDTASGVVASTVFGGAGADRMLSGGSIESAGAGIDWTFGYSALTDSTLAAMDTIAIGGVADSASYVFQYTPGGLTLASFSASGATGTNGLVTFSGVDSDLTSRVNIVDAGLTTEGETVVFKDSNNVDYLFISGGSSGTSDDLIVKIGTAGTSTNGAISLAGGKTVTVNLV